MCVDLALDALHRTRLQPEGLRDACAARSRNSGAVSRLSGIHCQSTPRPLPPTAVSMTMDKASNDLEESLSNIARHAKASQVSVGIMPREDRLSLTVRDNGVGRPTRFDVGCGGGRPAFR